MYNFFATSLLLLLFTACNQPQATNTNTAGVEGIQPQETAGETIPEAAPNNFTTQVVEADLPSPRKEMTGTIEGITLTVNYGSPAVKGRNLWGSLVPYDKVWRTGANEATRLSIDQTLSIDGKTLAPGTYGLFTVPAADGWEVILNSTADQWGAYEYDSGKDVLRFPAQPNMAAQTVENLEFMLQGDALVLAWGKLRLPMALAPDKS